MVFRALDGWNLVGRTFTVESSSEVDGVADEVVESDWWTAVVESATSPLAPALKRFKNFGVLVSFEKRGNFGSFGNLQLIFAPQDRAHTSLERWWWSLFSKLAIHHD